VRVLKNIPYATENYERVANNIFQLDDVVHSSHRIDLEIANNRWMIVLER
jgi:uncharacterized membrane protein